MSAEGKKIPKFAGIKVPPDLGRRHFFFLFLSTFIVGMFMAFPPVVQPVLLKVDLKVSESFLGTAGTALQNMSQIAMLLFAALVGAWSDKVGRKILAWVGFLILTVSIFLFGKSNEIAEALGIGAEGAATLCAFISFAPSKASEFVGFAPGLAVAYVLRLMIGVGIAFAFPQFITWVADYTSQEDRGKGMGFNGLMLGMSGLIVFIVFSGILKTQGVSTVLTIAALFAAAGFVITLLFLKNRQPDTKEENKKSFRQVMKIVNSRLPLKASYLCALVTRSDTVMVTTLLPLWAVKVATDYGMTAEAANQKLFQTALPIIGIISIVAFPIAGMLLDKWGRIKTIILSLAVLVGSFALLMVASNPFSGLIYLAMAMGGFGMSGSVAGANTWVTDAAPKEDVGTVLGGLNTMTPIGALVFLAIGGLLFDKYGPAAAFAVKGGADLLLAIWILTIRGRVEKESQTAS